MLEYKSKLEQGLYDDCSSIIATIQQNILGKEQSNDEVKAFFTKLVADNYRYISEMSSGERKEKSLQDALQNYELANKIPLSGCNPIKLSICLNMAVLYYEVQKDLPKATELTDKALAEALLKIDELSEADMKDAKDMIEIMKENVDSWKEEQE